MLTPELTSEAAALFEQGVAAVKAGDRDGAKATFQRVVEAEPDNESAWLWLASLYTELPVMAHCLQQVVQINPSNTQAAQALHAVLQRMQTAHQEASNAQTSAHDASTADGTAASPPVMQAEPFDFEELKRRGIVAAKGGRRDEARQCLLAACEANDSDAETWFWLSTVLDDPEDRQIALENVLTLDPLHAAARTAYEENSEALANRPAAPPPPQPSPEPPAPVPVEVPAEVPAPEAAPALDPAIAELPPLESPVSYEEPIDYGAPAEYEVLPEYESTPVETASGSLLGGQSKLFAHAGETEGESAAAPKPSRRKDDDRMIAGKYRKISQTPGPWGPSYVAVDVKSKRFYVLQSQKGEPSELRKGKVNFVMHQGKPYALVEMGTDGLSLRNLVSTTGRLPADMAVQYAIDMLKVVAGHHSKGNILTSRRTVAPESVAFARLGNLVLEPADPKFVATASGTQVRPFVPPEQANHGTLAPTSDIFAIGALLYFMVTGTNPPPGDRVPIRRGDSFFPGHFVDAPEMPEDLGRVIATALQPNPGDRYATTREMIGALRGTEAGRHAKREIPVKLFMAVAGLLVVGALGWAVATGKFKDFKVPFLDNVIATIQSVGAGPTPVTGVSTEPTAVPPPPLTQAVINGVDSRRFPANSLYFSALNSNGDPMPGFQPSMVSLRENGTEVTGFRLTELRKTTDAISVMVAMDVSDQMGGHWIDDAKTAVHILADRLQPGDQMSFFTFGGAAKSDLDYTVSKVAFLAAVDPQIPGGRNGWSLADVVNMAAERAGRQPQGGFTSLVVISNGGLPQDVSGMVKAANASNLPIFFVGMDKATYPVGSAALLAAGTGGVALVAETADTGGAGEAAKKVEKMLHNVYKITYDTPHPSADVPHELELTLTVGPVVQNDKGGYAVMGR